MIYVLVIIAVVMGADGQQARMEERHHDARGCEIARAEAVRVQMFARHVSAWCAPRPFEGRMR